MYSCLIAIHQTKLSFHICNLIIKWYQYTNSHNKIAPTLLSTSRLHLTELYAMTIQVIDDILRPFMQLNVFLFLFQFRFTYSTPINVGPCHSI